MKKMIFSCLVLSAVSFAASAQNASQRNAAATQVTMEQSAALSAAPANNDGPGKELTANQVKAADQKAEKNAKDLQTKLGLNAKQYAQVLEAEKTYQREADRYPAGKIPSGHASNITSQRNKQIFSVLNEEQSKKYEGLLAKSQG